MGRTVFISYSREDLEVAKKFEEALLAAGHTPWRDQESLYGGQQWPKAIGDAISSHELILLLWSKASADSHFVEFEWSTGIALRKTILPCLLDKTPLVPSLISFNGIALTKFEETLPKILDGLKRSVAQSDQKRASAVLERLQQIVPQDAESMARAGTMLVSRGMESPGAMSPAAGTAAPTEAGIEGMKIGDRYEVVKMLGRGGMGAVYHVYDTELERDVALKVIRAELASEPMVLQRFKREIQLSSEVTHPNVLRVYDLGEAEGVKFLTMQFVDGEDLTDVLKREGKLPKEKLVSMLRQIAQGLKAAHEKDVVHRDLKPANILVDKMGHIYITDFGLATSTAQSGLTQAGDVMGTPHYMAPEQVKGDPADAQCDIYALGVMLYEMATGELPFTGSTLYEIMMQRVQKDPRPASELVPGLPPFLSKIIQGCMARDKAARYASVAELLEDLEEGAISGQTVMLTRLKMRSIRRKASLLTWKKLAMVLPVLILVILGGWFVVDKVLPPSEGEVEVAGAKAPVTVLISDFVNDSGEAVFDGLAEQTLGSALEGASFITTFNRGLARKIVGQLKEGSKDLNEEMSRLVAQREGVSVVVSGRIERSGEAYEVSVRAVDSITGNEIEASSVEVDERDDVLTGLSRLAARIRSTLGDRTPESAQLIAAETFTASSFEAAQAYAQGQELFGAGDFAAAIAPYQKAIELDPEMGRAYASLAITFHNLERRDEAEGQFQLAMQNIDRMSERERLRTRGGYFLMTASYLKAIDELKSLVEQYPADYTGYGNLALAYFYTRNMEEAKLAAAKAAEIYPNNVVIRSNAAFYALYAGDFDQSLREARSILKDDPEFGFNYVCLALSELGRGNISEAEQVYRDLSNLGGIDATFASTGLSDISLYRGLYSTAIEQLNAGIAADLEQGDEAGAWRKGLSMAKAYLLSGKKEKALAEVKKIPEKVTHYPLLYEAAAIFSAAGQPDKALELGGRLGNQIKEESRLYALLIQGEARLAKGEVGEAVRLFQEAQKVSDSWLGRLGLGRAYLAAEAYTEAYSEFEQSVKRRGEASAVFLDDVPSFHYYPQVLYLLGRAQQGLGSPAARDSYTQFLEIKKDSEPDPMVEDARQRLADLAG